LTKSELYTPRINTVCQTSKEERYSSQIYQLAEFRLNKLVTQKKTTLVKAGVCTAGPVKPVCIVTFEQYGSVFNHTQVNNHKT